MLEGSSAEVAAIEAVLAFFGLGSAKLVAQTRLGTANQSFRVTTGTGTQYVVKMLIHQNPELLINELAIQQQLAVHNIVTPRYIQAPSGEYMYRPAGVTDLTAVISSAIPGVHPRVVNRALAFAMGSMLANYHAAVRSLPIAHRGWLNRKTVEQTTAETKFSDVKNAALNLVAQGSHMFVSDLPSGIIHGDFHIGNLLLRSERSANIVAMLDFEEAGENLLLVDIAFGLFGSHSLATSRQQTHAVMVAFLDGYESVRPLEPIESAHLADAIAYVAGACSLWMYEQGYEANATHNIAIADALLRIDLRR
jgi:Ser/Thr protein kinase RdoA (MazF antagonist)